MGFLVLLSLVPVVVWPLVSVSLAVQWNVFSIHTSYFWSRNATTVSKSLDDIDTCDPVHVSTVVRHGARNPVSSQIKKINKLHSKLLMYKSPDKAAFLDRWTSRYNISDEGKLVPNGAEEQEFIGSRFGQAYKKLSRHRNQSDAKLEFITSHKQRTIDSARSFYDGFAKMTGYPGPFTSRVNDSMMRFYKDCSRYETIVTNNVTNFRQFEEFSSTPQFQKVGEAVKQRLGLNITLTPDDLYTINEMCAYETYIFQETAWCDLLTDDDRKVLEYGLDIQQYYASMYGNPLNAEVACPLARDVFYTVDEAVRAVNTNSTSYIVGKFRIGHLDTVGKLLAFLGLYKETADMMASNMVAMENRHFRSSRLLSYSANVAFVLYTCTSDGGPKQKFKMQVFVNEEKIALPVCANEFLCDYELVRQAYSKLVNSCNEKQFCTLHSEPIVG